ncbi:Maf family protein [bacterium]|nr:Maf family protein [bacterium]
MKESPVEFLYENVAGQEIVLASSSPRRKTLLESLGVSFRVHPSEFDESQIEAPPERLVVELARAKADEVAKDYPASWVLAGDTVVGVDGDVLGKPADLAEAREMMERLSGRTHDVFGGVALVNREAGFQESYVLRSTVSFVEISEESLACYLATRESFGKAGAYAVQGQAQVFVREIVGSFTNIVGLDITSVAELLFEVGAIQHRSGGVGGESTGEQGGS